MQGMETFLRYRCQRRTCLSFSLFFSFIFCYILSLILSVSFCFLSLFHYYALFDLLFLLLFHLFFTCPSFARCLIFQTRRPFSLFCCPFFFNLSTCYILYTLCVCAVRNHCQGTHWHEPSVVPVCRRDPSDRGLCREEAQVFVPQGQSVCSFVLLQCKQPDS